MSLDGSLKKVAKGAGIGFFGTFIGLALGYVSRMIIARFLGPYDYGLVSLGVAVLSFASMLSLLGLPRGVVRFVSFYRERGDLGRVKGTVVSSVKVATISSVLISAVIFVKSDWISIHVFHDPNVAVILKIFALGIPPLSLSNLLLSATIGFEVMNYRVYVNDIFQNAFRVLCITVLIALGYGAIGASLGWVLAIIPMPILALHFLKRLMPFDSVETISVSRELLEFSIPLIFAGFAGLILSWTDTLMLGYFCTTKDVGIYNASLPTARLLRIFVGSFGMIFMSVASGLYSKGDLKSLEKLYSAVTKWIFTLALPLFLLMVFYSKTILTLMFGRAFVSGSTALSILALGFFVMTVFNTAGFALQVFGRTKVMMINSLFIAIINIVLNALLIPKLGIDGAAIATATSLIVGNSNLVLIVYHKERMIPFGRNYIKPALSAVISMTVAGLISRYIGTILTGVAYIVTYITLLIAFRSFDEYDLVVISALGDRFKNVLGR